MNMKHALLLLIIASCNAHAYTCPTNFSIINEGESIASVALKCGKPDKEKKTEKDKPVAQEWSYFVTETVATNTSFQATGTLKTTFTFDKDDKAINISVNGIGVGATTICGSSVSLGASREQVKATCGQPSFINKQTNEQGKTERDIFVEYTYNSTPPVTLLFKNGKLTGTK